jgi:pimeloyl-ACP methyl ester carboxylesterase
VENVATARIERTYPAPGKTYAVGDHRLHLDCRGTGGPTVVLFNGMGEFSASWARITDPVSTTTRVCAYDRAGQGWSDDVASPQDGVTAARDLHALLAAAGEHGPYVLVGHSIGGPYAMSYAATTPSRSPAWCCWTAPALPVHRSPRLPHPVRPVLRRGLAILPTLARVGLQLVHPAQLPAA